MTAIQTPRSTDLGEVLRPGDVGYDEARKVWNGTVDRCPAMIVRCRDAAQVAATVRFAHQAGLEIAVRGGGHSIPGLSVCEGGVMIDLSSMKRLDVDAEQRIARAEPGLLWEEYDAGTQAVGLASPGGEISHTGIAGLTLGGGIGWLSRRHGLACDNLIGAQVVLADGSIVEVDDEHDPELLWGLRGGGGNFGIVTEFRFRLHPLPPVYAGTMIWPAARSKQVLRRYLAQVEVAPRDLSLMTALVVAPPAPFVPEDLHFQPVILVAGLWTGDAADGPEAFAPFRDLEPAVDECFVQPYTALQQSADAGVPHGRRYHVRSEWLDDLDDDAVDQLVAAATDRSSPFNQILVRHVGGAIADVAPEATAFRFRQATHMLTVAAGWEEGPDDPHVAWTRATWERLLPWSSGGSYVNHLAADEGVDRVREAYGEQTWARLVALKRRVDPDNRFHLNQNVDPGAVKDGRSA